MQRGYKAERLGHLPYRVRERTNRTIPTPSIRLHTPRISSPAVAGPQAPWEARSWLAVRCAAPAFTL